MIQQVNTNLTLSSIENVWVLANEIEQNQWKLEKETKSLK